MSRPPKADALEAFARGALRIRAAVREDAKKLLRTLTLDVLSDEARLADWLMEMITALMAKHVIVGDRRLRPQVAALIREYVAAMINVPPAEPAEKPEDAP